MVVIILATLVTPQQGMALPRIGTQVPAISVDTFEDKEVHLRKLIGKVMLIIYEGRQSNKQNELVKKDLKALAQDAFFRQSTTLVPVAAVDSYSYWPAKGFARAEIKKVSLRDHVPVYCDWSGALKNTLRLDPEKSTILVFDPKGALVFGYEGAMPVEVRRRLINTLRTQVYGAATKAQGPERLAK